MMLCAQAKANISPNSCKVDRGLVLSGEINHQGGLLALFFQHTSNGALLVFAASFTVFTECRLVKYLTGLSFT